MAEHLRVGKELPLQIALTICVRAFGKQPLQRCEGVTQRNPPTANPAAVMLHQDSGSSYQCFNLNSWTHMYGAMLLFPKLSDRFCRASWSIFIPFLLSCFLPLFHPDCRGFSQDVHLHAESCVSACASEESICRQRCFGM